MMNSSGRSSKERYVGTDSNFIVTALAIVGAVLTLQATRLSWTQTAVIVLGIGVICYYYHASTNMDARSKYEIRFRIWSADDVLRDLRLEEDVVDGGNAHLSEDAEKELRIKWSVALSALAQKYGAASQQQKTTTQENNNDENCLESLGLICQEAAYAGLERWGGHTHHDDADAASRDASFDTAVVVGSLSLLALVAPSPAVRERHYKNHSFSVQLPLASIQQALKRARDVSGEKEEQKAAAVQRQAFLWIGALSDGHAGIAQLFVEPDKETDSTTKTTSALQVILEALSWFRYHEGVVNWGLWALFILGYEYSAAKDFLLQIRLNHSAKQTSNDALATVLECLRSCPVTHVQRHGIALLFDLLRNDNDKLTTNLSGLNMVQVRQTAVSLGLHPVLIQAMNGNNNKPNSNTDIWCMCQELLVGTHYQGEWPTASTAVVPTAS